MSSPAGTRRQFMEAVVVPTRRLSLVSSDTMTNTRATSEAESDYTPPSTQTLVSSSTNRTLRKRYSVPLVEQREVVRLRSRSSSLSSRKRWGVDKGKSRATIIRRSSRSSSVSSLSTLPARSRRSIEARRYQRESSISSGPIAGPSGTHGDDVDMPSTAAATEATFALLAAAADFVEDADAAVQILEDGSILPVLFGEDLEMGDVGEKVKREADESMVEDQLPPILIPEKQVWKADGLAVQEPKERREGEENECVICATDIEEVCTTAEEAGLGGLGGSLAVWVCERQACGAVFCVSCALEWANRAIQNRIPTTCPQCTRPTDIDALRNQAKAYNPNGPEDPINAPPPPPMLRNRYTMWIDHFFTLPANQPPSHDMVVRFLEQFLVEGIPQDLQENRAILAIHTRNAIMAWMSYWNARGVAVAQIGMILPQQYLDRMADFHNQIQGPLEGRLDMAPEVILPGAPDRVLRRIPRGRRVLPNIQAVIDRLRQLANAQGLLQNAIAVRNQIVDSLQQIANLGPGALGGGVALQRLTIHVQGQGTPIEKFTHFVRNAFNNADGIQVLLDHLYGTLEERERMGNMIRHERQGRQALTRLVDLPGLRAPPFNNLQQIQAGPAIGRDARDGVVPFPGRFLPDRRRVGPNADREQAVNRAAQNAVRRHLELRERIQHQQPAAVPEPVEALQQHLAQLDAARNDVLRRLQQAQAAQAAAPPNIVLGPPAPEPIGDAARDQILAMFHRARDQLEDLDGPRQQEIRRQVRVQQEEIRQAIRRMGNMLAPALAARAAEVPVVAVPAQRARRVRLDLDVQEIPPIPVPQARRVRLDLNVQEIPDVIVVDEEGEIQGARRVLRRRAA